jgi:hypothetical protein
MEGVAWRNLQIYSMNIKAGHKFKQRHLEAKFRQSKFPEPRLGEEKWMWNFFYLI